MILTLLSCLPATADVREQALEDHDVLGRVDQLLELRAVLQVRDVRNDEGHEEVNEDQRSDEGEADEEEHGEDEGEGVLQRFHLSSWLSLGSDFGLILTNLSKIQFQILQDFEEIRAKPDFES